MAQTIKINVWKPGSNYVLDQVVYHKSSNQFYKSNIHLNTTEPPSKEWVLVKLSKPLAALPVQNGNKPPLSQNLNVPANSSANTQPQKPQNKPAEETPPVEAKATGTWLDYIGTVTDKKPPVTAFIDKLFGRNNLEQMSGTDSFDNVIEPYLETNGGWWAVIIFGTLAGAALGAWLYMKYGNIQDYRTIAIKSITDLVIHTEAGDYIQRISGGGSNSYGIKQIQDFANGLINSMIGYITTEAGNLVVPVEGAAIDVGDLSAKAEAAGWSKAMNAVAKIVKTAETIHKDNVANVIKEKTDFAIKLAKKPIGSQALNLGGMGFGQGFGGFGGGMSDNPWGNIYQRY